VAQDVQRVNRSGSTLAIIALTALVIVLLAFPGAGNAVRSVVSSFFGGETALNLLGGVASIIGIISACIGVVRWAYKKLQGHVGSAPQTTPPITRLGDQPAGRKQTSQRVCDETHKVAQRISNFAAEFDKRSPFRLQAGEAVRLDFDSLEYQADQQEKGKQYSALVDEMQERYRVELLPDVIRIRGALADQGITDAQLEEYTASLRTIQRWLP
jgi:hypothetical protein